MVKRRQQRRDPLEPLEALPDVLDERQRPRPKKRDRSWDAQRSKATYDLPADLIERIREIAEEMGQQGAKVRVNDIARLLLEAGLRQYESGELDIDLKPTGFRLFDD